MESVTQRPTPPQPLLEIDRDSRVEVIMIAPRGALPARIPSFRLARPEDAAFLVKQTIPE